MYRYVFLFCVAILNFGNAALSQHHLSPDGKRYLYYAEVDNNTDIYICNLEGSDRVRLTNHPYLDYNPQWSRDGKHIVFYRKHPENYQSDIFLYELSSNREIQITKSPDYNGDPSFAADDMSLVFTSNRDGDFEIFVMDLQGANLQQLTHHDSADFSPVWSPDGSQIAFVSKRSGSHELWLMQPDGSEPRRITETGADNYKPAWSPDGTKLTFFSNRTGKFDVFVVEIAGLHESSLTKTPEWNEYSSDWLKDGGGILANSDNREQPGLSLFLLDGTSKLLIPESVFNASNDQTNH